MLRPICPKNSVASVRGVRHRNFSPLHFAAQLRVRHVAIPPCRFLDHSALHHYRIAATDLLLRFFCTTPSTLAITRCTSFSLISG